MPTYYNGFYYEVTAITALGTNAFEGVIYDSSQTNAIYRNGFSNSNRSAVTRQLKAWIDVHSGNTPGDIGDIEYDDLPDPVPVTTPGDFTPHLMYDCETGIGYNANTLQQHLDMAAKGYVHELSECKVNGNGNGNGVEVVGEASLLEIAGVFVVGVTKGTLTATIPIITMAVAVGFMKRVVKIGTAVGG